MKVSDAQDIRQALVREVEVLPDDVLPKVYKLVKLVSDRQIEVAEVIRRAQRIVEERSGWSRDSRGMENLLGLGGHGPFRDRERSHGKKRKIIFRWRNTVFCHDNRCQLCVCLHPG